MSEVEELKALRQQVKDFQQKVKVLEQQLAKYETNGVAKLFYSLNRKAAEMADLMNKTNLGDLKLDNKDDKTFERLKVIWNDAAGIAVAVNTLQQTSGVTGNESSDTNNPLFRKNITPESIANDLGNTAGKQN